MTALLAAMMVEEGKLKWNSTIGEVFPEITNEINSAVRKVTLEQLLSHTSGITNDDEKLVHLLKESFDQDGNLNDLRYWLIKQWLKYPLATEPGKKFSYSNVGYIIIGAMIERVGQSTWDEMITKRIFIPLGLINLVLGIVRYRATRNHIDELDLPFKRNN